MTKRIFNSIRAESISLLTIVIIVFMGLTYNYFTVQRKTRLKEETDIIAKSVEIMGIGFLEEVDDTSGRITWIDNKGNVIFDSRLQTENMENHLHREEIAMALETGYGYSRRYSQSLTQQYLYSAKRLEDGSVIRLSVSQKSSISLLFNMIQPICIVIFAAVLISLALATHLSKSIITPLNSINLDNPTDNSVYDELSPLLKRIDSQQKAIKLQSFELQRKKDELDTIVENMNEGIVLLKANGYVVTINDTARKILDIRGRATNKLFLSLCKNIYTESAIQKAQRGISSEYIIDINDGRYSFNANPVFSENNVVGVALLFFDITEKEKAEQMRREFTANVSHELKSPLHAIAGYSELIMNGITEPRDTLEFSKRINSEAVRMNNIIQDIITLSKLDEGGSEMVKQPVELYSMVSSAVLNLKETAEKYNIELQLEGKKVIAEGVLPLLQSAVNNLCENSIKYNNPGGYVKITVGEEDDTALIAVEDNGIGISEQDKEKVFQRFYRADKSRSREKGGSGLGLSIVKHAVKIHNGKIDLESAPGKGTKITIKLPK